MRALLLSIVVVAGCGGPGVTQQQRELMVECMVQAAVAVNRVDHVKRDEPKPAGCCKECKNTGKVLSGDGISKVDCECPATCECKVQREHATEAVVCKRCLGLGKVLGPDGKRITRCEACGGCTDGSCRLTK